MAERKAFLLRLEPTTHELLQRWADADFRSLNAQIEFLLRKSLKEVGAMEVRPERAGTGGAAMMSENDELARVRANWKAPSELNRSFPREIRLTKAGVAATVLSVFMLVGGIALATFLSLRSVHERQRHDAVEATGREAKGTLTRVWSTDGKNTSYHASYTFDWEGATYEGKARPPRSIWRNLKAGDPITIRVAPADPEWNYPTAWPDRLDPVWLAIIPPAFLWIGPLLITYGLRRQRLLLTEGRAVPAMILDARKNRNRTTIRYDYMLPSGEVLRGRTSQRQAFSAGSVQCALYLPDSPRKSALYPLDLVRIGE